MLIRKIEYELERCTKEIEKCKRDMEALPAGRLRCFRNGKYIQHFQVLPNQKKHLSKRNLDIIKTLGRKRVLEARLMDLKREKKALLGFVRSYGKKDSAVELLRKDARYSLAIEEAFPRDLKEWAEMPFEGNPSHKEGLKYKCKSGHIVRSKSEVLIAQALYDANIPFRYEAPVVLNGVSYYPDFTIRHPVTGKLFYWEHWGLMDDFHYAFRQFNKLSVFYEAGIVPFANLLITAETADDPLNLDMVYGLIEIYFS